MNQTDQAKLCKAGYVIIRKDDTLIPSIKCKDASHPYSWKRYGGTYPSKAERDRAMKRLLLSDKIVEA